MTKDQQRKRNNYLSFIVLIVHVCAEKQSAVKPRDAIAIGGKEKGACTYCGQLKEYPRPIPTPLPPKLNIFTYFELIPVYFCLFCFSKFYFTYILIIYDVPSFIEGRFQVPGFRRENGSGSLDETPVKIVHKHVYKTRT